jgi:type VI secretion system protein ImpG
MSQPLESYYERELAVSTELARAFARQYPAEAGRLLPDRQRTVDPHAERLIQAFALLAGRIHYKLDSDFPELNEALLGILYPHLLLPIPSMTIAQFEPPSACPAAGIHIDRQARLTTRPLGNPPLRCRWQTGYPVSLWPLRLTEARWQPAPLPASLSPPPKTAAALRLQFECLDGHTFAKLEIDKLRLYLSGDKQLLAGLYEVLFNHVIAVVWRGLDGAGEKTPIVLKPAQALGEVGLNLDEGLLPFPAESFVGNRLLFEFLSFPEKFRFVDLFGWRQARAAGFGKRLEVILFLNRTQANLEQGVAAQTFRLGATPIVNLFPKSAEPIGLSHTRHEQRIAPARHYPQGMEIYSVDEVTCLDPQRRQTIAFQPFYAFYHGQTRANPHAFWYASRRASPVEGDRGSDVFLTLVDGGFDARLPAEAVLDVRTTCSNRDVPRRFLHAGDELFLEPGGQAQPVTIRCLHAPTEPLRPPLRHGAHWRLLAQNCLNHTALSDPGRGLEALQEMLRLCDFTDPDAGQELQAAVNRQVIEGITALRGRPVTSWVREGTATGACRGVEFTIEFDELKYVGTGMYLFASVLERFLGLSAALNSFSQLIAKTKQGERPFKRWPPRAAQRQLG